MDEVKQPNPPSEPANIEPPVIPSANNDQSYNPMLIALVVVSVLLAIVGGLGFYLFGVTRISVAPAQEFSEPIVQPSEEADQSVNFYPIKPFAIPQPDLEGNISYPIFQIRVITVSDTEIVTPMKKIYYFGKDQDRTLANYDNFDGVDDVASYEDFGRISSRPMNGDGDSWQFLLDPYEGESYTVTFKTTERDAGMIEVLYGYLLDPQKFYFHLEYTTGPSQELKLKISPEGITSYSSLAPEIYTSESTPIDTEAPEIKMQTSGNLISVSATDNDEVIGIHCAVSPKDPVGFNTAEAFEYVGPVEIDTNNQVLVCEAKDATGNTGYMWNDLSFGRIGE